MAKSCDSTISLSGLTADPEEWITCFIKETKSRGMTWQKALEFLGSLFEGDEKLWFDSLYKFDLRNSVRFKIAFLVKFGSTPTQGLDESVAAYYDMFLAFSKRLSREQTVYPKKMLIKFIEGLREPIRSITRGKSPSKLEQAREIAITWETSYAHEKQKGEAKPESKKSECHVTNEELSASIQELRETIDLLMARQKHENALHCSYCDKPRHIESQCRLKQQNIQKLNFVRKMLVGLRYVSDPRNPTQNAHFKCAYCLKQNHPGMCELSCPLLKRDLQSIGLLPSV